MVQLDTVPIVHLTSRISEKKKTTHVTLVLDNYSSNNVHKVWVKWFKKQRRRNN